MNIRFVRTVTLESLRGEIRKNLSCYREGDFSYLELDPSLYFEIPLAVEADALTQLKLPVSKEDLFEIENCLATFKFLAKLSPYDARDERLWVYLSHTSFLEYSRARWPIPDDDDLAVSHISVHFFARNNRQIERDNAVSRLWWISHLCARVEGLDLKTALDAFLLRSDVRANVIERPTMSQSLNVFSTILRRLIDAKANDSLNLFKRENFRALMARLNSVGGYRLLDILPPEEVERVFDELYAKIETETGLPT